jgi:osmoprotectant transport system substrate-binding protein
MRRLGPILALVLAVVAGGCREPSPAAPTVVVGVGSTTEQRVLAALTVAALDTAGVTAEVRSDLGGTIGLRRAAIGGNIDVFWDYTGAAWALGMGQQAPPSDPEESYQRVARADEANGLTWGVPSHANATLALFVRRNNLPTAQRPRGLGWLAGLLSAGEKHLCADQEFITSPGGLEALASAYAIDVQRLRQVTIPATEEHAVSGVAKGRCFAGLATATSGEALEAGLVPVADDLRVFPAFVVAPVSRAERLQAMPQLGRAVDSVAALLDTATLAQLNARVVRGDDPAEVAHDLLSRTARGS